MARFPRGKWSVTAAYNITSGEIRTPMRPYVRSLYDKRRKLSREQGWPLKVVLNSLYGKTAQTVGRRRFTSAMWAGRITAHTRARLSEAMEEVTPVMVMTDSIFSLDPLPDDYLRDELGGWELADVFDRIWIAQPGIMAAERAGEIVSTTTRGFPKMDPAALRDLIQAVTSPGKGLQGMYAGASVKQFVTLGMSLARGDLASWRTWSVFDKELHSPRYFGTSKREVATPSGYMPPRPWPGGCSNPTTR